MNQTHHTTRRPRNAGIPCLRFVIQYDNTAAYVHEYDAAGWRNSKRHEPYWRYPTPRSMARELMVRYRALGHVVNAGRTA
jgi:hypothetical protein